MSGSRYRRTYAHMEISTLVGSQSTQTTKLKKKINKQWTICILYFENTRRIFSFGNLVEKYREHFCGIIYEKNVESGCKILSFKTKLTKNLQIKIKFDPIYRISMELY